jgi:TolB protein
LVVGLLVIGTGLAASAVPAPAASHKNGQIAFVSIAPDQLGFGIWTANPDGTCRRSVAKRGFSPAWSPDGKKIVYENPGNEQLYVMSATGKHKRKLTTAGGVYPEWSPDGHRIAFHLGSGDLDNGLAVVNADGSHRAAVGASDNAEEPTWSANATKIAYVRLDDGLWRTDDTHATSTSDARLTNGRDGSPDWAPAGDTILFDRIVGYANGGRGSAVRELFTVRSNGTGLTSVTKRAPGESNESPAYSPDGKRVIWNAVRGDKRGLRVMSAGGGTQHWVGKPLSADSNDNLAAPAWGTNPKRHC